MQTFNPNAATLLRNFNTINSAPSGLYPPSKSLLGTYLTNIEALIAASWLNNPTTVAGADYAVTTADDGNTIVFTGSAFKTTSFGAASGYSGTHKNLIVNKSSRTLKIAPAGLAAQTILPGQCCWVMNTPGNVWYMSPKERYRPASPPVLHVNGLSGSDSTGDGLATGSGAFATPAFALATLLSDYDPASGGPTINLWPGAGFDGVAGAYDVGSGLLLNLAYGGGQQIVIKGDASLTESQVSLITSVDGGKCIWVNAGASHTIGNLSVGAQTGKVGCTLLLARENATLDAGSPSAGRVRFFKSGGHVQAQSINASTINLTAPIIADGAAIHAWSDFSGLIVEGGAANVATGLTFGTFWVGQHGGRLRQSGLSFTFAFGSNDSIGIRRAAQLGSGIELGGVVLPGNTDGSAADATSYIV